MAQQYSQDTANSIVENVNYFGKFRGGPNYQDRTEKDILATYRSTPAPVTQVTAVIPVKAPARVVAPRPLKSKAGPKAVVLGQEFLDSKPSNFLFKTQPRDWTGRNFLGEGGFGQVNSWEYTGPAARQPRNPIIAVKEIHNDPQDNDLAREYDFLRARATSRHIVTAYGGQTLRGDADLAAEQKDDTWDGVMFRMFMEYVPGGSLYALLNRRIQMNKPFTENTLWNFFNCLVDGAAAITDGFELSEGPSDVDPNNPRKLRRIRYQRNNLFTTETIHSDLKPGNVLVGSRSTRHTVPILKIADFGLAYRVSQTGPWTSTTLERREGNRRRGTVEFYAPEQFTERWDHSNVLGDASTEPIAGKYSSKTNIWGIACIMYKLILLMKMTPIQRAPGSNAPTWPDPYLPVFEKKTALDVSHGIDLQQLGEYSSDLRELIQECLYDNPDHRPTLEILKGRVMRGLVASDTGNPESIEDFLAYNDPILVDRRAADAAIEEERDLALQEQLDDQQAALAAQNQAAIALAQAQQATRAATQQAQLNAQMAQQATTAQQAAAAALATVNAAAAATRLAAETRAHNIGRYPPPPFMRPQLPDQAFRDTRVFCSYYPVQPSGRYNFNHPCMRSFETDGVNDRCIQHQDRQRYP